MSRPATSTEIRATVDPSRRRQAQDVLDGKLDYMQDPPAGGADADDHRAGRRSAHRRARPPRPPTSGSTGGSPRSTTRSCARPSTAALDRAAVARALRRARCSRAAPCWPRASPATTGSSTRPTARTETRAGAARPRRRPGPDRAGGRAAGEGDRGRGRRLGPPAAPPGPMRLTSSAIGLRARIERCASCAQTALVVVGLPPSRGRSASSARSARRPLRVRRGRAPRDRGRPGAGRGRLERPRPLRGLTPAELRRPARPPGRRPRSSPSASTRRAPSFIRSSATTTRAGSSKEGE